MNKSFLLPLLALTATICVFAREKNLDNGYPISPVPFTSVKIDGGFWGDRLQAARTTTIPLAFSKCEETGRYENFVRAASPSEEYKVEGFSFDDTDVYKTIEGASYLLQTYPDAKMEAYIDSVLQIVAAAQEPDGYLYTSRTMNPAHPHPWAGSERWVKEEDLSHELYNLGHMIEGAIAHYQATGKRNVLDIAIKYADCVCENVGPEAGQHCVVPGHQIAEMALAKLYLITGDKKYLDEAKFLLDYRGKTTITHAYSQAHKPVIEQDEAVGHAVRAAYMYAGMADVAALTGDTAYIDAIDRIWDNIVGKKYYITGGIGATSNGEAFLGNYDLPNMSAYCETCAAIGNVYVNYRLFLLHGDSKYYDVLERSLYNGVISGMSIDGGKFFYPNPLQSVGQHHREPWFGCACCPSNLCRFIPSVPGYAYATKGKDLYVNLYMPNSASLKLDGKKVEISQQTGYPWDGDVLITIDANKAGNFAMKLRIPGWVQDRPVPSDLYSYADGEKGNYSVTVNGEPVEAALQNGYFTIDRKWKAGDQVRISFDMQPRLVVANENVAADKGRVAIERGPIVYCAEWPDNDGIDFSTLIIDKNPILATDPNGSITVSEPAPATYPMPKISVSAQMLNRGDDGRIHPIDATVHLIPYYAWCHRGSGNMMVWLPQELGAVGEESSKEKHHNQFLDK